MIPKIIHQVWIGPNPIPKHCKEFSNKMKIMNPSWKHILWDNYLLDHPIFKEDPLINEWKGLIGKNGAAPTLMAERIRFLALKSFGGIYADIDAMPIKPFDFLIKEINPEIEFFGGIKERDDNPDEKIVDCALIGSVPKSIFINNCLKRMEYDKQFKSPPSWCVVLADEIFNTQEKYPDKIHVFEKEYFYDNKITDKTIILHDVEETRLWSWNNGEPPETDS